MSLLKKSRNTSLFTVPFTNTLNDEPGFVMHEL